MMFAGRMDRRIVVESYTETRSTYGDVSKTWSTHQTLWANYVQKTGKEVDADKNINHTIKAHFITRYVSTITPQMRIIYEGDWFNILEVKELGRKEGLKIEVELLNQT